MTTTALSLDEIHALAYETLSCNGADHENANALANTIMIAERDGSTSHGLFRLPAYIASLRSGKANGKARPVAERITSAVIRVDGDLSYAPHAQAVGLPLVIEAARENGVALLALTRTHHMAALWPEVEALANEGLAGLACVSYMPMVAPAGARKAFFGTNPIAFAWPRPGKTPLCYDMATAAMAMGEVQVAAREGHSVPEGTGLDKTGHPSTDPAAITDGGVLLPFGGYKGSAIATMVELLAGGLLGEQFSYEAKENDNGDGGPPRGGEFILAMDPARIAGEGWEDHCESFFEKLVGLDGTRLPGARRHKNRLDQGPREINSLLIEKIRNLKT